MSALVVLSGAFVLVATALPFWRRASWWVRVWDFPRVQIAWVAALALLAAAREGAGPLAAAAIVAALAVQLAHVAPYTRLFPREVPRARGAPPERTISLLVSNVRMENREADALIALVRRERPDVVLLLEPDAWWARRLRELEDGWPHAVEEPLENRYGLVLRSRLELVEPELLRRLEDGIPAVRARVRLASGELVRFHGIHPRPPVPPEASSSKGRDAELLLVAREVAREGGPAIVAGDLNDVAWSRTTRLFRREGRMLDPRRGRGTFATFHAASPLVRFPLDHVFVSREFALLELRRLGRVGSDHLPILARLALGGAAEPPRPPPRPDRRERAEASERIAEGLRDAGGSGEARAPQAQAAGRAR
jgi:endonuclease/exonuclease/phosphatase (EEP) superfamily protein YafD